MTKLAASILMYVFAPAEHVLVGEGVDGQGLTQASRSVYFSGFVYC